MPDLPLTMHALLVRRFGGPEVVEYAQLPVPVPGPGEVLLKVEAASLNPVDWKIRSGRYPAVTESQLPYVLGRDCCGVVVDSGQGGLPVGSVVHGLLSIAHGSLAEYAVARADELVPAPGTLDRSAAAAVPLAGLTAWQGLFEHGRLQAGQRVLIHGGSGGVGHFAVQFAKARGATVVTTVSTEYVEFASHLGADVVIDHLTERFEDRAGQVDLVYDLVGGETQERSWGLIRAGGSLVCTVAEPPQDQALSRGVRALRYTARPDARDLREIDALIDANQVRPFVIRRIEFADAAAALRSLEEEGGRGGKLVVDMSTTIVGAPDHPWQ